jgi:Lar family restriction alleviation protein
MTNNPLVEALLPCPFCGGEAILDFSHEAGRWDVWEIECHNCCIAKDSGMGFAGPEAKQAAIAAWNTRTALTSSAPATGEREQIVGWLRGMKDAPGLPAFGFKPHYLQGIYADGFADAIARGDHRTQSGEMEGGEHV